MKTSTHDSDGADAGQAGDGSEDSNEPLFGDPHYLGERLKALRASGGGRSEAEKQAVREALDGWRWI